MKLVWVPWHKVSDAKPIPYTKLGKTQKAATALSWVSGRELLSNAYFNHRNTGKNKNKQHVKVGLLFNRRPGDREEIRK
jgi:hypothetical protein